MRVLEGRHRAPLRAFVLTASALLLAVALIVVAIALREESSTEPSAALPSCKESQARPVGPSADPSAPPEVDDPATGPPVGLEIPSLALDAPVTPISLNDEGRLIPPPDVTTVGWWSGGALPGKARGTVVCAGHSVRSGDGVFDALPTLEVGAAVHLRTTRGTITYTVQSVEQIDKDDLPSVAADLFSREVPGRLLLITCSDYRWGSYHANTIVTATPQPNGA